MSSFSQNSNSSVSHHFPLTDIHVSTEVALYPFQASSSYKLSSSFIELRLLLLYYYLTGSGITDVVFVEIIQETDNVALYRAH